MDISKDNELFYLGCVLSEAIEKVENLLRERSIHKNNILRDSRFKKLIDAKERWIDAAYKHVVGEN